MAKATRILTHPQEDLASCLLMNVPQRTRLSTSLHSLSTSHSKAERSGPIKQRGFFSTDVRCNTKYFRAWVWTPSVKKAADSLKWLPWAKQAESSSLKLISCPDLGIFSSLSWDAETFCSPHMLELTPLSMGNTYLPLLSHKERPTNTRKKMTRGMTLFSC